MHMGEEYRYHLVFQAIIECFKDIKFIQIQLYHTSYSKIFISEDSFIPCDNSLTIENCSSSETDYGGYGCNGLSDGKLSDSYKDGWWFHSLKAWVQVNLNNIYYLQSVRIFQSEEFYFRPKNISLQFSDGTKVNITLNNAEGWNDIILPSNITSNLLNISIMSKYKQDFKSGYINEVQLLGCRPGKQFNENKIFYVYIYFKKIFAAEYSFHYHICL